MSLAKSDEGPQKHERFDFGRRLGAGAFGVVYEAYDREYRTTLAVKILKRMTAAALYRFKQEFRILTHLGLRHRNLIRYYELLSDAEQWFITMELVQGTSFLHSATSTLSSSQHSATSNTYLASYSASVERGLTLPDGTASSLEPISAMQRSQQVSMQGRQALGGSPIDLPALRSSLSQLAQGLLALHAAGILHRDIKPSNVLVEPSGRVVLLDFGLAGPFASEMPEGVAGTPIYMAPDRWLGEPESEASDWYSVGVMLYQCLCGVPPFSGPAMQVLDAKASSDPLPPSARAHNVPADLEALCVRLLRRKWQERPSGQLIAEALSAEVAVSAPGISARNTTETFIGRASELVALENALEESSKGPLLLRLSGESGMGKSALLRHFVSTIRQSEKATVFSGRCHEWESVPYKAFDGLIDALRVHLLNLAEAEQLRIRAPLSELARLFPVLQQRAATETDQSSHLEPQELRRRAFRALKELLTLLHEKRPLVLAIDDVQWGDLDSARLLHELLSVPAPQLLLILCFRREDREGSPFLREVLAKEAFPHTRIVDLELGPLAAKVAEELAVSCLTEGKLMDSERLRQVLREAQGSPLFIQELSQRLHAARSDELPDTASNLRQVMLERITKLGSPARRLLEVTSVAGRPIDLQLAFTAAELLENGLPAIAELRELRLVRGTETGLEVFHDRIREALCSQLTISQQAECHARIAGTLEARSSADPEHLAQHWASSGNTARAAPYARAAAERAFRTLAFDRAARWYGFTLEWGESGRAPELRHELEQKRADALAYAGRGEEAANAYRVAAGTAPEPEATSRLKQRAVEELLLSGHVDEGVSELVPLLRQAGVQYPKSTLSAVFGAVRSYLALRFWGARAPFAQAPAIAKSTLAQLDLCWSASQALQDIDPLRSAWFQLRFLRLALKAGEPGRAARGLSGLGAILVMSGRPRGMRIGDEFLARAQELGKGVDDPFMQASLSLHRGLRGLIKGDFASALTWIDIGTDLLRERCRGTHQQQNVARAGAAYALEALGKMAEVKTRALNWESEAGERGDRFAAVTASLYAASAELAQGELQLAKERATRVLLRWSQGGFHVQHMSAHRILACSDLIEGRAADAYRRVLEIWPQLKRAHLLQVQFARFDMTTLRARATLALAVEDKKQQKTLLRQVEQDIQTLQSESRSDAAPTAHLLQAGVMYQRGDVQAAGLQLKQAIVGFAQAEMPTMLAATDIAIRTLNGPVNAAAIAAERAILQERGIGHPELYQRLLLPGLPASQLK